MKIGYNKMVQSRLKGAKSKSDAARDPEVGSGSDNTAVDTQPGARV
jgi:hypothetical protein